MVAQKPLEDQLIGLSDRPGAPLEVHAEPTARWVRAVVDGVVVADSKQVLTVTMGLPVYYFPRVDVRSGKSRTRSSASDPSITSTWATGWSRTRHGGSMRRR